MEFCPSGECQPTQLHGSGFFYVPYHFSLTTGVSGWGDTQNYFQTWGCSSLNGINYIARLRIAPLGSHPPQVWKDSLYADMTEYVGDNPVLHFTASNNYSTQYPFPLFSTPTFSLEKAEFHGTKWVITRVQDDPSSNGGISSLDGTKSDYVMNEYYGPGWGPVANLPGGKIPGVSTGHFPPNTADCPNQSCAIYPVGYPLWGSGPLGLTRIQNQLNSSSDPNTRSCQHMNPTLFDYDATNAPQSFLACLFAQNTVTACNVPEIQGGLQPAHYAYHYNATTGWQLDPNSNLFNVLGDCSKGAVNYIRGSNRKFIVTDWNGGVDVLDLNLRTKTRILDCTTGNKVTFSEASGREDNVYLLADYAPGEPPGPDCGQAVGLDTGVCVHDVYVAFRAP